MKKHFVGIAALIGFIIGLWVSFSLMVGVEPIAGLYTLSLGFVVDALPLPGEWGWVVAPIFFVALYTCYGAVIGFLIQQFMRKLR
jgi:hypothetical protein